MKTLAFFFAGITDLMCFIYFEKGFSFVERVSAKVHVEQIR